MGGSTTFGRPYDDATSFCGWLRELLPELEPAHEWEVVNAGGVSYASYRVSLLMEELVKYDPDIFVIYSGQNEFLEDRTYRDIISHAARRERPRRAGCPNPNPCGRHEACSTPSGRGDDDEVGADRDGGGGRDSARLRGGPFGLRKG